MRAIIKTFTYLLLDAFTHSTIIYVAGHLLGYNVSIAGAGTLGVIIEIVETIAYYGHEKLWERIKWLRK